MLADCIHPEIKRCLDVVAESLFGRGGVDSVGPEALIQRPVHEDRLAVQQQPRDTLDVRCDGDRAHPEVAANAVLERVVRAVQEHVQAVKKGVVRGPEPRRSAATLGLSITIKVSIY